jgi:hypothetical protein
MRTFIGWWLSSREYTDRADIPRNEVPELVDGAVQVRYDLLGINKSIYRGGVKSKQYTYIIECDFKEKIEQFDYIYVDKDWRKVDEVEEKLPKEKQAVIKAWPGKYQEHAVKVVYLL